MATLVAPEQFDPTADAEALRKACEGWGTNEKGVINVICHRNAAQRKLIKEAYQHKYNENLIRRLLEELSGNFEKAVYRWMLESGERGAVIAYDALKKDDFRVIVEISCLASSEELLAIKQAYKIQYQRSLEEDVATHFTGDMRKLLLLLVSVYRNESGVADPKLVEVEAKILHDHITEKAYNHEEIIRILTTRSKAQLISTIYRYGDAFGTPLAEALEAEHGQDFVAALQVAIRCIKSAPEYLEQVLSNALFKHENKEETLTRVIVTRAENDLATVKDLFYKRHSRTLEEVVGKETHWDYKPFLLALIGYAKP